MAILFHFFVDSSQVIVVVVHWHLTSNSHLIEHSGLSPFPIKPVCWKGIQIGPYLGSWYKRRSGISQFIKQASNHHTGNVYTGKVYTEQISENKIFVSRYNRVQREKC